MKRNLFIKSLFTLSAYIIAPFSAKSQSTLKQKPVKPFMVAAGKDRFGKSISLFEGDTFFTKISTKDTGGDLYVFESTRIKKGGPTLHFHYDQDEWWYVLKGEFIIKVGDITYEAKSGDSVFGPRGVPHAFAKMGEGEGKLLMVFQPAGKMEAFFEAVSEGKLAKLTLDEQDNFRKAHGFERVGPVLTYEKKF